MRTEQQGNAVRAATPLPGRHRAHLFPARPRRLTPRFSDGELAELQAAAAAVGMTPTGFCADAALAAARGQAPAGAGRQDRQALAVLQRELFDAATSVHQAVTALQAGEQRPPGRLDDAVAACLRAMERLDDLAVRVDRTLR